MPDCTLKHKDHNLCTFAHNRHQIDYAAFKKASLNELPLPIWRVFNYKEEFIEYKTEDFLNDILNSSPIQQQMIYILPKQKLIDLYIGNVEYLRTLQENMVQ